MKNEAIQVLQKASELGLKLGFEPPDTLTFQPDKCCPPTFVAHLKAHKAQLLELLKLPFVMVYSKAVEETLFFCQDENTRAALIEAGAEPFSIYTRAELEVLVQANRIAPLTKAELGKLHDIKRTFGARIEE